MFSISLSFSFVHSLSSGFFCLISSFSSFIVSIVLCSLALPSFHHLQFLSNLVQYSSSYLLSDQPNSFLAINHSSSSSLLNVLFFFSCFLIFSISYWYSFLNSSTAFFAFSKFSFSSQVLDSAINPFYYTKYLSFPFIYCLFRILSTSYSSSPLITTGAGCSFLYPSTCPIYFCILLTFTTGCILIVLSNSNSTTFADTIFFTL